MNIYSDYLRTIEAAMNADTMKMNLNEDFSHGRRSFPKGLSYEEFNRRVPEKTLQPSLEAFSKELGLRPNFEQRLGLHPDFSHLKYSDAIENHYIVSMFVDIKGSTNLFKRYTPETVLIITNTIQRAAIHTCLILGGYVHRLQGDGLFVYFGGKTTSVQQAVLRSLQFSSIFTYFVKHDIKNLFYQRGIETIFTRIGIDLGYDEDVVWALAGLGEISEVTTCSLHTSLASKMQGHAQSNGIVVGDNVFRETEKMEDLFTPVCHRTQDENDRYIFQIPERKLNYTQFDFAWMTFLKRQAFVATDLSGNLQIKNRSAITLPRIISDLAPVAQVSKPYLK
jgi:adenylate cyclase